MFFRGIRAILKKNEKNMRKNFVNSESRRNFVVALRSKRAIRPGFFAARSEKYIDKTYNNRRVAQGEEIVNLTTGV